MAPVSILGAYTDSTSLFPTQASKQDQLIQQVAALAKKRIADQQTVIDDKAAEQVKSINSESDKYITVRASIYGAQAVVDIGKKNVANMKSTLLDLHTTIAGVVDKTTDVKTARAAFDAKIMSVNQAATSSSPNTNLIGALDKVSYEPDTIQYRNDLGAGVTKLQGAYSGGGYRIEANDGTVWVPDLATDSISQYSNLGGGKTKYTLSDGTKIDTVTSTRNGVKLQSYNPATGAISMQITVDAEQAPITVNGTLKRSGIKVMQSWFYDGLATDSGRARAHADLTKGVVELTFTDIALTRADTRTKSDARRIDAKLKEFAVKSANAKVDQSTATQKLQEDQQRQVQAMILRLNTGSKMHQNYIDTFASFVDNPFLDFLV